MLQNTIHGQERKMTQTKLKKATKFIDEKLIMFRIF